MSKWCKRNKTNSTKGGNIINIAIWGFINIAIFLAFLGLGIYVLILLIKALKIYINKNSWVFLIEVIINFESKS